MTLTQLVHTEEVTGSIPVPPTRSEAMWISIKVTMGAIPVAKWLASRITPGRRRPPAGGALVGSGFALMPSGMHVRDEPGLIRIDADDRRRQPRDISTFTAA
jgi:hypothetical protein